MKKILIMLSLVVMVLFIVGCGKNSVTGGAVDKVKDATSDAAKTLSDSASDVLDQAQNTIGNVPATPGSEKVYNDPHSIDCVDSDGKMNWKEAGSVTARGVTYNDACANDWTLQERDCFNGQMISLGHDCGLDGDGYKCINGACQQAQN